MKEQMEKLVEILKNMAEEEYELSIVSPDRPDNKELGIRVAQGSAAVTFLLEPLLATGIKEEELAAYILINAKREIADGIKVSNNISELVKVWDTAKNYLIACTCKKEDTEFLKDKVWYPYLDLAIYFRLFFSERDVNFSIIVTEEIARIWGITVEDLKLATVENWPAEMICAYSFNLKAYKETDTIEEYVKSVNSCSFCELMKHGFPNGDESMVSLTYKGCMYGGSILTREDIFAKIADSTECDLLIIPSSIEEICVLAYSYIGQDTYKFHCEQVEAVNAMYFSGVKSDMSLSDHAYIFSRKEGKVLDEAELTAYFNN